MKHTVEEICKQFGINQNDVLNVYAYGSRVYGTATPDSDYDYVVVHKAAMIGPNKNAFRENAKTSEDGTIQIINFSRTGFKAELQSFNISCMECISLPEEYVLQKKMDYKIDRFDMKEFISNVITKASNSWHLALTAHKDENYISAAKGLYHSLRILDYALQIKNSGKVIDFSTARNIKTLVNENILSLAVLYDFRTKLIDKLKENGKESI
jgi:predicted nucleotidyltransferase